MKTEDIEDAEEDVSCIMLEGKKNMTPDEQLAVFMHRFNLDQETVEAMPAFTEHCKVMFCKELKPEIKK